MADYVPVYSRRERRFRNLGKILFIAMAILVVCLIMSIKVSVIDNDFQFEWVELENDQGEPLSGLLLTPNDAPETGASAVIITHDLGGHKEQNNRLSFELAREGFVVLALDLRDHGRSRGYTTFNDYYEGEAYDIIAAYYFLAQDISKVDPERIAVVGDGFGGAACLMANNILLERNITLAAVVAWAPPIDMTPLYNDNWDEIEPFIDRRIGDVVWTQMEERNNRSIVAHMDAPNWDPNKVYIIYGGQDKKIPDSQFGPMVEKAELFQMADLGHDLSEDQRVLEFTIDYLYRRLEVTPRVDYAFNYEEVESVNRLVHASSFAVMVFAFMMVYEVLVMKKTSRSYIPQFSKQIKPIFMGVATIIDIVAYVAIASIVGRLYSVLTDNPFMDILPAARFYYTLMWASALMIGFGMLVWYIWSFWMPRDDELTVETCGNLRGILSGMIALIIIIINFFLGQVLLFGPNYPKGYEFLIVALISFGFFMGHELWMRKLLHMKIKGLLSRLFLRHRLPYHLTFFGIMYGLYALLILVMMWNVGREHFDVDFQTVYFLMVTVIGLGSTIIYHRSNSLMASVTYSAIMAPWLLNIAHHL